MLTKATFDKGYAYSVLHYLKDENELEVFVMKAISLVKPGGLFLLGDIPNKDKLERYTKTEEGALWRHQLEAALTQDSGKRIGDYLTNETKDPECILIDDQVLKRLIDKVKNRGHSVQFLERSNDIPFGKTREDILITV